MGVNMRCRYLWLGLALLAVTAWAGEVGIAARVNGAEISNFRLERYFSEYLAAHGRNLGAIRDPRVYQRLRRAALEELIDKELLWQTAIERGLEVDEQAVQAHFDQVRGAFASTEEFHRRLQHAGFAESDYRDYLRREQVARRMLERLAPVTAVADEEVQVFLQQNPSAAARSNEDRERARQLLQSARQADAARAALAGLRVGSSIELYTGH